MPFVATLHPGTVRIVLTRGLVIFQSQQQTTIETPRSMTRSFSLTNDVTGNAFACEPLDFGVREWSTRAVGMLASHPVATILESDCPSLGLPDALCGSKSRLFVTGDRSVIIGSPEIELLPARRCRPTVFSKLEIEKTKQKPKQPLKLFSGLILISFFRSHFNSSCVLSLLHYTPGQSA